MLTVTVRCDNPECRYAGQERTVGLQHLGQGVYLFGDVYCECSPMAEVRTLATGGQHG